MARDSDQFLSELPIWKLKLVASELRVDVSGCRYKRDYVERLAAKGVTEEQIREALARASAPPEKPRELREIEEIAAKPPEPLELPTEEEAKVERYIDESLTLKPQFFEVDSITENALNKMILGDYAGAIKANREARMKCLDSFSRFQVFSTALSLRAAEELISRLPENKGRLDPTLRTALAAAKRGFILGSPRQREEALESLETLATKAYEAALSESEKDEAELRDLLADYEAFGTRTEEARRYLEIAASARLALNFAEHRKYIEEAKARAENAKALRRAEIESIFPLIRASAEEARALGADVAAAEARLGEARKAFEDGLFGEAVRLLADIERQVDEAHLQQVKREKELEQRQLEKASADLAAYEPLVQEGVSYGLALHEGLQHAANARAAIARKDVVGAVKFTRRLKDIALAAEKDIDRKRAELGIIKHLEDATCGKCGKNTLYAHPDGRQKCLECGHSFSVSAPAAELTGVPQDTDMGPPEPSAAPAAAEGAPTGQTEEAPQPVRRKRRLLRW